PLKYAWLTGEFEGRQLKNGRLAQGCVTGSLRISPKEQLDFLEKLVSEQHSAFSKQTQKFVKDICPTKAKLSDGTPVYGKTGAGTLKSGRKIGWLVGWTKNKDKDYCYAYLNENEDSKATVKERWQNVKYRLEKAFGDKA
ncbi:MAG: Beta-lactamase Class, partial [Bacillota bacterium]